MHLFSTVSWRIAGGLLISAIGVFSLLFLTVPEIDLWFSALFFEESDGFAHAADPIYTIIRDILLNGLKLVALLSILIFLYSFLIGKRRIVSLNVWKFLVASIVAGPLVLVNSILKTYWGRARPFTVEYFGGPNTFTPPMVITDQCDVNCSFVSGEGSAIATALIILAVVLWANMTNIWRTISLYIVLPFSLFGIALRIITGQHFLSDTIFGALYCALIVWAFYKIFDMANHLHDLTWTGFKKDFLKK